MTTTLDVMAGGLLDFFGLLFAYTGLAKLATLRRFRYQLLASGLLGRASSAAVAAFVPAAEVLGAGAVLARFRTPDGMAIIVGLLVVFTAFIGVILARGKELECHCFGGDEGTISRTTLLRNLLLLTFGALAWFGAWRGGGSDVWTVNRVLFSGYAVVAAFLFLAGLRLLEVRKDLRSAV